MRSVLAPAGYAMDAPISRRVVRELMPKLLLPTGGVRHVRHQGGESRVVLSQGQLPLFRLAYPRDLVRVPPLALRKADPELGLSSTNWKLELSKTSPKLLDRRGRAEDRSGMLRWSTVAGANCSRAVAPTVYLRQAAHHCANEETARGAIEADRSAVIRRRNSSLQSLSSWSVAVAFDARRLGNPQWKAFDARQVYVDKHLPLLRDRLLSCIP